MRVHIIGNGVVGGATARGITRFGHKVITTDKGDSHQVAADITLICVPEKAVPDVIAEIVSPMKIIVIRSSVPVGTTLALAGSYPDAFFFHWPEFLRESAADDDFLRSKYAIIGCASDERLYDDALDDIRRFIASICKDVFVRDSGETELLKLANNAYLATLISYWNQISALCCEFEINSHDMARIMTLNDERIGLYGAVMHGGPYGKNCLPKDIAQLISIAHDINIDVPLLEAVQRVNQSIGGK